MPREELHNLPLGVRASFGSLPPLAGKFSGSAIVLGRGGDWITELDIALETTNYEAPIIAANAQVGHYDCMEFEHIASVHCSMFPDRDKRNPQTVYHCAKPLHICPKADMFWPLPGIGGSGSSALLAAVIALNMGFDPIYVAGVHLEDTTCVVDAQGRRNLHSYRVYQDGWRSLAEQLRGRVFSVSPRGTFLCDLLN